MYKAESNQVRYELNKSSKYSPWMNLVVIIILLAIMIIGAAGYFLLLNKVFGKVTFSFGSFLVECLLIYLLSIFLHEMGHLFMAKRYGYPFRIFKAGGILAFNNSFRKINIKPSQFLTSGFVMLNYNEVITSRHHLSKFIKNDFKYIALGGMFVNFSLVIIGILFMLHTKTIEFGYLLLCYNIMILIAQLVHPSDLTRYWFIHKNPRKAAVVFTEELSINWKVNPFLEGLFDSYIEELLSTKTFDQHLLAIIQRIIESNLIHHQENSKEIDRFIIWFRDHFDQIITMGLGIRVSAERLMNVLKEYNMVDSKDISRRKPSPVITKHAFHTYYLNIFDYRRKLSELDAIRKESGNNGLPF
jgi:hypothetical protein